MTVIACPRELNDGTRCKGVLQLDQMENEYVCNICSRRFRLISDLPVPSSGLEPNEDPLRAGFNRTTGVDYNADRGRGRRRFLEENKTAIITDYCNLGEAAMLKKWGIARQTWKDRKNDNGDFTHGLYIEWGLMEKAAEPSMAAWVGPGPDDLVEIEVIGYRVVRRPRGVPGEDRQCGSG
jgi:hypothetical protein